MIYLTMIDETPLCPDCAYRCNLPLTSHIHEEGRPIECDECQKEVESAYGIPSWDILLLHSDVTEDCNVEDCVEKVIQKWVAINQVTYVCSANKSYFALDAGVEIIFKDGTPDEVREAIEDEFMACQGDGSYMSASAFSDAEVIGSVPMDEVEPEKVTAYDLLEICGMA